MNHRSRGRFFPAIVRDIPVPPGHVDLSISRQRETPSGVESRQDRLANSFSARGGRAQEDADARAEGGGGTRGLNGRG